MANARQTVKGKGYEPKLVVIGGGTGSFTLLSALKDLTPQITALVNMADDGGSTGVLRDELGVLPPGDVRQCLIALSEAPEELRQLFSYRFPRGIFSGHSFGNVFLSAVEKMTDSFDDAVRMAGDVLRIRGRVLPITLDDCQLVLRTSKRTIRGQRKIATATIAAHSHPEISFRKAATITPAARQALTQADLIVIAPGDLYASLAPVLLVSGVAESLQAAKAPVVFVCNLVNKPNHTADFAVHDYVAEIERFIGAGSIDYVLYNTDTPTPELLKRYALDREFPVVIDRAAFKQATYKALAGNFLSHEHVTRDSHDSFIKRSLIRHDAKAVALALQKLL